jgi:hypothetical protein
MEEWRLTTYQRKHSTRPNYKLRKEIKYGGESCKKLEETEMELSYDPVR